jgi:protein-tyrosine phosphatase
MPFGAYDTGNRVLRLYREHKIEHVFILATDEEIKRKARRDIKRDYEKIGALHSQLAIQDMTAPRQPELRALVAAAKNRLIGHRIAVHCHAGVGRTSVFVCCIVQELEGVSPQDSIAYVKKHMEVDMTAEQMSAVMRFGATEELAQP